MPLVWLLRQLDELRAELHTAKGSARVVAYGGGLADAVAEALEPDNAAEILARAAAAARIIRGLLARQALHMQVVAQVCPSMGPGLRALFATLRGGLPELQAAAGRVRAAARAARGGRSGWVERGQRALEAMAAVVGDSRPPRGLLGSVADFLSQVEVRWIVEQAMAAMAGAARAAGVELVARSLGRDMLYVPGCPEGLKRVVADLVANGVQAAHAKFGSRPGGRVEVEVREEGDFVVISISDNGKGLSAEEVVKLNAGRWPGGGLGFSNAIETMGRYAGGAVSISSPGRGKGACVEVRFAKLWAARGGLGARAASSAA